MDKIKSFAPLFAFLLLFAKAVLTSFDIYNTAALLIVSALFGFVEFNIHKNEMNKLSEEFKKLQARQEFSDKKIEEVKSHVSGIKLSQQIKPQQFR